jgi:GntR family transcriptional regulator of arabinose operon
MIDFDRINFNLQAAMPGPLHARVRDALSVQITDGTLKPGDMLPSERSLQDRLHVSRATVRQALRGLMEAGLIQSVPGSGNFVLGQEKAVAVPRPATVDQAIVGLIVSYPSFHIYYGQLAAVFNQRLRQAGWHTDMALHNDRADNLQEIISSMLLQGVRVFSINPPAYTDMTPILDDLLNHGALVQLLGRWVDYPRCDYIGANNELLGYQATQHLIQLGHSQIIYQGGMSHPTGRDRATGYVRAMLERGLQPHIFNLYIPDRTPAPLFESYLDPQNTPAELFSQIIQRKITAAFCFNDENAARIYNEIRNFNLSVPRDLSLVSVDNMPFYGYFDAPLTTFALPGEEVGRQAAELLLRRLAGETFPPQRIYIPAHFVLRLSTAPPRD